MNCSFSSAPLWSPGCPGPAAPSVGRFLRAALWSAARCRPRWWWACWWCSWLGWRIAECWASRRSSRRRGRSLRGQCKQNDVKHFCFTGRVWMSACGSAFAAHWRSWWSWSFRPDCLSAATSAPSLCRGRTPTSSSGWCSRRPATCQLDTHRKHISQQQHTHTHIDECFKADCRPASLTQRRDDVAKGNQRLVDVSSFLQSDAGRSGGVGSLAAGQIDQVDLTDRLTGHLCIELSLTETETEREMSQFEYLRCDMRFFSLTWAKSSRPAWSWWWRWRASGCWRRSCRCWRWCGWCFQPPSAPPRRCSSAPGVWTDLRSGRKVRGSRLENTTLTGSLMIGDTYLLRTVRPSGAPGLSGCRSEWISSSAGLSLARCRSPSSWRQKDQRTTCLQSRLHLISLCVRRSVKSGLTWLLYETRLRPIGSRRRFCWTNSHRTSGSDLHLPETTATGSDSDSSVSDLHSAIITFNSWCQYRSMHLLLCVLSPIN